MTLLSDGVQTNVGFSSKEGSTDTIIVKRDHKADITLLLYELAAVYRFTLYVIICPIHYQRWTDSSHLPCQWLYRVEC